MGDFEELHFGMVLGQDFLEAGEEPCFDGIRGLGLLGEEQLASEAGVEGFDVDLYHAVEVSESAGGELELGHFN
jgi:hypothetical protein